MNKQKYHCDFCLTIEGYHNISNAESLRTWLTRRMDFLKANLTVVYDTSCTAGKNKLDRFSTDQEIVVTKEGNRSNFYFGAYGRNFLICNSGKECATITEQFLRERYKYFERYLTKIATPNELAIQIRRYSAGMPIHKDYGIVGSYKPDNTLPSLIK